MSFLATILDWIISVFRFIYVTESSRKLNLCNGAILVLNTIMFYLVIFLMYGIQLTMVSSPFYKSLIVSVLFFGQSLTGLVLENCSSLKKASLPLNLLNGILTLLAMLAGLGVLAGTFIVTPRPHFMRYMGGFVFVQYAVCALSMVMVLCSTVTLKDAYDKIMR